MRATTRTGFALALAIQAITPAATALAQPTIEIGDPLPLDTPALPGAPDPERRQSHPRLASSGGLRLLVFRDAVDQNRTPPDDPDTIAFVRMRASDGAVLGGGALPIPTDDSFAEPEVAVGGSSDAFLIVHTDRTTVYGRRMRAADGALLDASPFVIARADGSSPDELAITSDGTNFLVAWTDGRNPGVLPSSANRDVFTALVPATGPVADPNGRPFATGFDHQSTPSLGWDGSSYVLAFRLWAYGDRPDQIRVRRLGRAGAATGSTTTAVVGASDFALAIGGGRIAIVHDGAGTSTSNALAATLLDAGLAAVAGPVVLGGTRRIERLSVAWNGAGFFATWAAPVSSGHSPVQLWGSRFTNAGVVVDAAPVALGAPVESPDRPLGGFYPPPFTHDLAAFAGARWLVVFPTFDPEPTIATHRIVGRFVDAAFPPPLPVDAGGGGGGGGGGGVIVCRASPSSASPRAPLLGVLLVLALLGRRRLQRA